MNPFELPPAFSGNAEEELTERQKYYALRKANQMPEIRTYIRAVKAKNGKLLIIHRTTITDVKPIDYYAKVIDTGLKGDGE